VNDFLGLPWRTLNTQSYDAGVIESQLTDSKATMERAQRLYAIGELAAAAELLSKLAAETHLHKAEGRGEKIDG